MHKTEQPVTLITGTSRGIGKELVKYYIARGHIVIGCSRGNIDYSFDNYIHFVCDITDEKKVIEIFKYIKRTYKKLDNLINNAGVDLVNLSVLTSISSFEQVMSVNMAGTFLFSREAANLMIKNKYGRIVNFTSITVPINAYGHTAYTVSKAGIEMMTKSLAKELAPYNITVNAIGPSITDTEMLRDSNVEKLVEQVNSQMIIKEYSTIQDITNVIDFFIQKESCHITAQIIYLCGAV